MKGLVFVLVSTFLVGMATGVFIYFISGLSESIVDLPDFAESARFEITADAYGGCQMMGSCPSYRIDQSGEYTYIVFNREGENDRSEGRLPSSALRELRDLVEETPFERVQGSTFTGTCPIAFDGPAYIFTVRLGETEYRIDTCEHDAEGEPLFELLQGLFGTLRP